VLDLTGGPGTSADPRFQTTVDRLKHADEIDALVGGWIRRHTLAEVLDAFDKAEAAIGPVYDIAQIFEDPQYQARESVTTVQDEDLGPVRMQNVFPRLSRTPGRIRHAGPRLGQHTDTVIDALVADGELSPEAGERIKAKSRGKQT